MGNRTPAQLRKHYRDYQGKPEQIAKRAKRNKARAEAVKAGRVHKGDGKDIDHKRPLSRGGSNARSNTRVVSESKNRGYPRDSKNRPV